jgi:phospholipid/cholesterol/gamma-HCH transport system substrate-binding protein
MENKAHALAASVFVIGLAAALVALVVWLTRDDTVRNLFELSTHEPVSGLQPQATVRYRGVAVGKVASIDFDPKVKGNVRVRITVDERVPLTTSTFATLSYQGVTGLASIALDDKGGSQEALVPDNRNPPRIPLQPSLLAQLQDRGEALLGQIEETTRRINALVGQDNQKRIAEALDNIAGAAASANQLTKSLDGAIKADLTPALKALPSLVGHTQDTLVSVKGAAGDVSRAAGRLDTALARLNAQDGAIDRLGDGTRALSQAVESFNNATLPRLNRVADDTSNVVRRLGRAVDSINDNPQLLLFGGGATAGPGEPGFAAPSAHP